MVAARCLALCRVLSNFHFSSMARPRRMGRIFRGSILPLSSDGDCLHFCLQDNATKIRAEEGNFHNSFFCASLICDSGHALSEQFRRFSTLSHAKVLKSAQTGKVETVKGTLPVTRLTRPLRLTRNCS